MHARIEKYAPTNRHNANNAVDDLLAYLDSDRPLADATFYSRARPWRPPHPTCLVAWRDGGLPIGFLSGRHRLDGSRYKLEGTVSFLEMIGTRRGHGTIPTYPSLGERLTEHFAELAAAEGSSHLVLQVGASETEIEHTKTFFCQLGFIAQDDGWWSRPIAGVTESAT